MASYNRTEQQENAFHGWSQQQESGLEVDSSQKRAFSDKQAFTDARRSDPHEEEEAGGNEHQSSSRNPWGLSPLVFGLLVALVTAVVIGGAIGGGVGSQIKSSTVASTSASTTTVFITKAATATSAAPASSSSTYTDYVAALPAQILSVPLNCPALNNQPHLTAEGDTYIFDCGVDYGGNDLAALIAYRVEDCCTACSAYNYQQEHSGLTSRCEAFTFNANMSYTYLNEVPPGGCNCWLKSQSDAGTQSTDNGHILVGGKLSSSG